MFQVQHQIPKITEVTPMFETKQNPVHFSAVLWTLVLLGVFWSISLSETNAALKTFCVGFVCFYRVRLLNPGLQSELFASQ